MYYNTCKNHIYHISNIEIHVYLDFLHIKYYIKYIIGFSI